MQLDEIKKEAIVKIEAATTMQELNELRAYYMGKKSPLAEIMKTLASATIEEKKTIGAASNKVKQEIELAIANKRVAIENAEINAQLEKKAIDVTMDGYQFKNGSMHPLNKVIEEPKEESNLTYTIDENDTISSIGAALFPEEKLTNIAIKRIIEENKEVIDQKLQEKNLKYEEKYNNEPGILTGITLNLSNVFDKVIEDSKNL